MNLNLPWQVSIGSNDKPTGWGVGYLTELNDNSNYYAKMYSEIKHSLNHIHILKFELF